MSSSVIPVKINEIILGRILRAILQVAPFSGCKNGHFCEKLKKES